MVLTTFHKRISHKETKKAMTQRLCCLVILVALRETKIK